MPYYVCRYTLYASMVFHPVGYLIGKPLKKTLVSSDVLYYNLIWPLKLKARIWELWEISGNFIIDLYDLYRLSLVKSFLVDQSCTEMRTTLGLCQVNILTKIQEPSLCALAQLNNSNWLSVVTSHRWPFSLNNFISSSKTEILAGLGHLSKIMS